VEAIALVALEASSFGSTSSGRWIVLASNRVASVIHLAARPVGAQSVLTPLTAKMRKIDLTMAVLPTPGPPVTALETPFRKQTANASVQRQATFRRFKSCTRNNLYRTAFRIPDRARRVSCRTPCE
jgi:hypothetical protein